MTYDEKSDWKKCFEFFTIKQRERKIAKNFVTEFFKIQLQKKCFMQI